MKRIGGLSTKALVVLGSSVLALSALFVYIARLLEVGPFMPHQPKYMPADTIWIDAPFLPLAYHHGEWLGCSRQGERSYRCQLVRHSDRFSGGNGKDVMEADAPYSSCTPVQGTDLVLAKPRTSIALGLAYPERRPLVFLKNGTVLLPTDLAALCSECQDPAKIARLLTQ